MEVPSRARVVVIGGGVIGASIAYHLGHLGWSDTVLVERDQLTSGTTWHAAGLMVTFGSTSETSTELRRYSRDLYARLEAETGLATGFKPVGFVELAAVPHLAALHQARHALVVPLVHDARVVRRVLRLRSVELADRRAQPLEQGLLHALVHEHVVGRDAGLPGADYQVASDMERISGARTADIPSRWCQDDSGDGRDFISPIIPRCRSAYFSSN